MKIVFLDFDGVIVSMAEFSFEKTTSHHFDPRYIARLNAIVRQSGAKVVISSSWRTIHSLSALRALLESSGFKGEIIDCTPVFEYEPAQGLCDIGQIRGREIQAWLERHPDSITSFVVLDDLEIDFLAANQILTDMVDGLCEEHVEQALAILG